MIFAEVPSDSDLDPGAGLLLLLLILHGLVYPDGGEAVGPGVPVEQGGHQGAGVRRGAEDNLRKISRMIKFILSGALFFLQSIFYPQR